jgi:hypothetical protein
MERDLELMRAMAGPEFSVRVNGRAPQLQAGGRRAVVPVHDSPPQAAASAACAFWVRFRIQTKRGNRSSRCAEVPVYPPARGVVGGRLAAMSQCGHLMG